MALAGMITDHRFTQEGHASEGYCGHRTGALSICGAHRDCHVPPLVTLPSGPPVRSDYERALERIRELEEMLKAPPESEAHVWKRRALDAESQLLKNIDTIEALRRENAKLTARLNNLDTLARSISKRVEEMTSALDR